MKNTTEIFTTEKTHDFGECTYELKVIENELVPVYVTSKGEKVVYGTELYGVLGSRRQYTDWIKGRLLECDAVEDMDYQSFSQKNEKPSGGRPGIEYIIKLDTAKEMAMLERNAKGKQVRRYFIKVEKKYKENNIENSQSAFMLCLQGVKFVADDMRVSEASKLYMYNKTFEEFGLPTGFLPKYEDNGSREQCSASELLKRNGCDIGAVKFNQLLIENGYLEERERASSKGGKKKFKALTDKGLKYGSNLINEKNQKEVQPYYYADTFMELFDLVQ